MSVHTVAPPFFFYYGLGTEGNSSKDDKINAFVRELPKLMIEWKGFIFL